MVSKKTFENIRICAYLRVVTDSPYFLSGIRVLDIALDCFNPLILEAGILGL